MVGVGWRRGIETIRRKILIGFWREEMRKLTLCRRSVRQGNLGVVGSEVEIHFIKTLDGIATVG